MARVASAATRLIVRVVPVVEPLLQLWFKISTFRLASFPRGVIHCRSVEDGPGLDRTSHASLRAAIFASDPPLSGCAFLAACRYARLIVFASASLETPITCKREDRRGK